MGILDGKIAFITGAARGQGRSHAIGLAAQGADIIAVDLCNQVDTVAYPMATKDDLAETVRAVEALDRRILAVEGDVRDLATLKNLVTDGVAEFGGLDIVLANAGIMPTVGERADDDEAFYDAVDIMLTGVWHTLRACVPPLIERGSGSIVITSSTVGLVGAHTPNEAGSAGYAAAKHGVVGLMRVYANMLAKHDIRVNTVHPTGVNSPMIVNQTVEAAFSTFAAEMPGFGAMMQNLLPVQVVEPEDVTNAILWLVSDAARYVTGIALPVDAGFTVRA